jgi:hypothetical protein
VNKYTTRHKCQAAQMCTNNNNPQLHPRMRRGASKTTCLFPNKINHAQSVPGKTSSALPAVGANPRSCNRRDVPQSARKALHNMKGQGAQGQKTFSTPQESTYNRDTRPKTLSFPITRSFCPEINLPYTPLTDQHIVHLNVPIPIPIPIRSIPRFDRYRPHTYEQKQVARRRSTTMLIS